MREGDTKRLSKKALQKVLAEQERLAKEVRPLTKVQRKELDRRVRDMDNPHRYVIVSAFSKRFVLYYNVSEDVYAMNDVSGGTLFKRRKGAEAIAATLRSSELQIIKVKKTAKGIRMIGNIIPWGRKLSKRGPSR